MGNDSLQQMLLGKLDSYMHSNETVLPYYAIYKIKYKMV